VTWADLLLPLSPLYAAAVSARAGAYARGWLRSRRLEVPVVSVGNLTFGGTGKTPTVVALVRDLVRRGRRPAVLSRGYRRSSAEPLVAVGPDAGLSADTIGDEPAELARRLPGVPIVVDADRVRGGRTATAQGRTWWCSMTASSTCASSGTLTWWWSTRVIRGAAAGCRRAAGCASRWRRLGAPRRCS
jgi:tetraacyldisaccharide-1-P 4'-kinase